MADDFTHIRFFKHGDEPVTAAIPLDDMPQIASRIGIFLALFAVVDLTTRDVLAKMLDLSQERAQAILGPISSYAAKLDMLEQSCLTLPCNTQSTFAPIIEEMRWANTERNRYAHSQYAVREPDQGLHRIEFFTDLKRSTKWTPISHESIDTDINRMRRLAASIWQAVSDWQPLPDTAPPTSS
jgi:hypothetical protein